MATKKDDNDAERFARIEELMEEYRINHEDLTAYVNATQDRIRANRARTREALTRARASAVRLGTKKR